MTKVAAIVRVMQDQGGTATLQDIYQNIEKYYPGAKADTAIGQAGIRGVLYREIKDRWTFEKIGPATYALQKNTAHITKGMVREHNRDMDKYFASPEWREKRAKILKKVRKANYSLI